MNEEFNSNKNNENEEIKEPVQPETDGSQQTDKPENNSEYQPTQNEPEQPREPHNEPEQPFVQPQPQYEQKHYVPNGFYPANMQNSPKGSKTGLKIFAVILAVALIFSAGTVAGRLFNVSSDSKLTSSSDSEGSMKYNGEDIDVNESDSNNSNSDIKPDSNGKYTAEQVAKLVGESVVNIQVYSTTDTSAGATASGVVLNKKGYIITNDHIYSEVKNAKFVVNLSNGKSYKATYLAGDKRSDIAVIKIDDVPSDLKPATFIKDSSKLSAGEDVIAIGSPGGLSGTVTKGIVSYPSRRITSSSSSNSNSSTSAYSMRVIQTDVALNPGNSGGALVNMYGQVVGISSSKISATGYEGLCFAIPANDAIKYAKSLVKNGKVTGRAKLGITYTEISSAVSLVNDLPTGLRIQEISADSDLSKKNITTGESGDIITKINDKKITSSTTALDIIDNSTAGDEITLEIYSVSTKKTSTYKIKLLEDTSNTSYSNEIPHSTTPTGGNYYYYGDGNDSNQNPFSFGN